MTPEQNARVKTLSGKQEIFDYVIKHLRSQRHQSLDYILGDDGHCAYRGTSSRMCAVGCLIADDEYSPGMEGQTVDGIDLPRRFRNHKPMLEELQRFHDYQLHWDSKMGGFSELGESRLEFIRVLYGLKKPEA